MKTLLSILCALALLAVATPVAGAAPRDRDRDGLPDRWELRHHLSIKMKTTNADPDRDRVVQGVIRVSPVAIASTTATSCARARTRG